MYRIGTRVHLIDVASIPGRKGTVVGHGVQDGSWFDSLSNVYLVRLDQGIHVDEALFISTLVVHPDSLILLEAN